MRLAVLYSGGKDSNFAVYKALEEGYDISLLITIIPSSEESMLFHYPNIVYTKVQAECMNIPIIIHKSDGDEMQVLYKLLLDAKRHNITHIASGGITSRFQNERFMSICKKLDLTYYSPLWAIDQIEYMHKLLELKFELMLVGVSAYGLDERWLGRIIDKDGLEELIRLSKKYGFNPAFEGGEAETFVLDAPHFKYRLMVKGEKHWDGVRGIFTITDIEKVRKIF